RAGRARRVLARPQPSRLRRALAAEDRGPAQLARSGAQVAAGGAVEAAMSPGGYTRLAPGRALFPQDGQTQRLTVAPGSAHALLYKLPSSGRVDGAGRRP